jgi:uncharacterized membrane protein
MIYSSTIKQTFVSEPLAKPGVYVMLWLAILLMLSIVMLIRALVKRPQEVLPPIWNNLGILTIAALVIYILVVEIIGAFLSSFLLLSVLFICYSMKMGKIERKGKAMWIGIAKYIMLALIVSFVTVEIFRNVLNASLPTFDLF